jgi:uncharacterized membrane protein
LAQYQWPQMNSSFGIHLIPFLVGIVLLVALVLLTLTILRRVHDSWHRK